MKNNFQKSCWVLVLSMGALSAAQALPDDSATVGRMQQSLPSVPSSSGTTVFYYPEKQALTPPSSGYRPWTLFFQGQEKCLFVAWQGRNNDISLCARITSDGSGNAELYQAAGRMGQDMRESGWFEALYPQVARQWPNWPVQPTTEAVAFKKLTFYSDVGGGCTGNSNRPTCTTRWDISISIEPIFGPSGLPSDWRFNYLGQNCVQPELGRWVVDCTLPYTP